MTKKVGITSLASAQVQEGPANIYRTTLAYNEDVMMCRFIMKPGGKIPLHEHPAVQVGYVIRGKVRFRKEDGEEFIAESGSSYLFDSREKHGAQVLEEAEVIECFSPMRPEYS